MLKVESPNSKLQIFSILARTIKVYWLVVNYMKLHIPVTLTHLHINGQTTSQHNSIVYIYCVQAFGRYVNRNNLFPQKLNTKLEENFPFVHIVLPQLATFL